MNELYYFTNEEIDAASLTDRGSSGANEDSDEEAADTE